MADSTILPAARAQLITAGGLTAPEFYRFFQAIAQAAGLTGEISDQVKEIETIIQTIVDRPLPLLLEGTGIAIVGTLADVVVTISLDTSGAAAGTYGDATHVPQVTVDSYGRVTGVSLVEIEGGFVPYLVPDGTIFRVPANKQALWTIPIELEGDAGLEIDGALVEVN